MTESEAIDQVKLEARADDAPCLATDEVTAIVQKNVFGTVWIANTAYALGAKIQPITRSGHFYKCIQAGTSGASEPTWTTCINGKTSEGDLIWQECGFDPDGNLYDLETAIYQAWTLKASKAAKEFDVSIENQKWSKSQLYDHCVKEANKRAPSCI